MKKLILLLFVIFLSVINVSAKSVKGSFSQIISDSGINKDSIAISVRDVKTGKTIYALNDKIMMNPASIQKVLTMTAATEELGEDYKFSTELYSKGNDSYIIKLSGDPYLKNSDLKSLTRFVKIGTQNIYIDDSILDKKYWGEGWQWDDNMNELMPKFGAYNLDKNLIKLQIIPSEIGQPAKIVNSSKYPLIFINNIKTSNKTSINVNKEEFISNNTLVLNGTVSRNTIINIPSDNIKRYFEIQLKRALEDNKIYLKNSFALLKKSDNDTLVNTIDHELSYALNDILKNSNNMAAEIVFKLAGGKYMNGIGTDTAGIEMFNNFCSKHNLDPSLIKITDGSGVSKNNLLTASFVSEFLYLNKDSVVMKYLPAPSEGTMVQRLLTIKENLKAKTGTLSNISSIAGYITSKSGHEYTFCILQNDVKLSPSDKKSLEDYIIREIYLEL